MKVQLLIRFRYPNCEMLGITFDEGSSESLSSLTVGGYDDRERETKALLGGAVSKFSEIERRRGYAESFLVPEEYGPGYGPRVLESSGADSHFRRENVGFKDLRWLLTQVLNLHGNQQVTLVVLSWKVRPGQWAITTVDHWAKLTLKEAFGRLRVFELLDFLQS